MDIRLEDKTGEAKEKPDGVPVPDGQERLATQPERDDVNGRIEHSH
ncbi:MAG TPA: hypothetical protein VF762_19090 [Blastocatellia bacterium]|jgi:hypothetical protein